MFPLVEFPAMLFRARTICLQLLTDCMRAAASRTFWTAGKSRPIKMAMMAITTNSSISVKPRQRRKKRSDGIKSPLEQVSVAGASPDKISAQSQEAYQVND